MPVGSGFRVSEKEAINLERLTEDEFLFIWGPVLGPDTALGEYHDYQLLCDIDEIDFGGED